MASVKPYPITGVQSLQPELRFNINHFSTAEELKTRWYLFLRGLQALQDQGEDSETPLGYYQIAGIHGAPYIQWMESVDPEDRPGDYCAHGSALFLTWHRPYLLLLEQRIVEEAMKVANGFSDEIKETYLQEASKIRLPYWDWASDANLPEIVNQRNIDINLPTADSNELVPVTVPNPLYSYKFKDGYRRERDFSIIRMPEFLNFAETRRCPDKNGESQPDVANQQLNAARPRNFTFRAAVFYLLMTEGLSYGSFSNTNWRDGDDARSIVSLEDPHNTIHVCIGSDMRQAADTPTNPPVPPRGHMSQVSVAAYDPIFWLHHGNVDRIYALWQAIRYTEEFESQGAQTARLPRTPITDTAETTLRPFYHDSQKIWINSMVQRSGDNKPTCVTYNYYYPEIDITLNEQDLKEHVMRKVYELYAPETSDPTTEKHLSRAELIENLPSDLELGTNSVVRREWMIILRVGKYLIQENVHLFFFLGDSESTSNQWSTSENLIGSFHTFKSPIDVCANCASQEQARTITCGGIHISDELARRLDQDTKLHDIDKVTRYIDDNLTWKIMRDDHTVLNTSALLTNEEDSLYVGLVSFNRSYASNDEKPDSAVWDTKTHYMGKYDGGLKKPYTQVE